MMITILFAGFLLLSMTVALTDWRRGWLLAVLCGILQDPARKLTPNTPVVLSLSVIAVYAAILFAAQSRLQPAVRDFSRRFGNIWAAFGIFLLCLALAALNGLMTFGLGLWKVPLLSLFIYLAPLPAVMIGYLYLDSEKRLYSFFRFYAIATSIALIGSLLEYLRVESRALGMVAQAGDYIRHLPGIQIRMISGFYRAPDIMAWHAAMLASIAIAMAVRSGISRWSMVWLLASGWGFFNALISGRRKAIYFIVAFSLVFLWRYYRRLKPVQVAGVLTVALLVFAIVQKASVDEKASVYTKGALATRQELTARLEGGVIETISQFGIFGAGLGTATQGVYHVAGAENLGGWQEGGLGKLAIEVGIPGLLAATLLAFVLFRMMLAISGHGDIPESSQFARATLFALAMANIANFLASAQSYSDPVLTLITAFLVGCLFATATLDERAAAAVASAPRLVPAAA
jgi:hypothetical protein